MKHETVAKLGHLNTLSNNELIGIINELLEEKQMNEAFSHISETGHKDAALMWQGRNKFLAENVAPVSIRRIDKKSFPANLGGEHRIIDGDNLAVMRSLLTEFRGGPKTGFDIIYLDPPYNTGNDTFIYNDSYRFTKAEAERLKNAMNRVERSVSMEDPSRHTKWINHIAPRIWAARKLLKHTGILIVSIDEYELPRLWLLLDEMFGDKNRIATIVWEKARKNDATYISEGHEYLLVWARDKEQLNELVKIKGKWRERKPGLDIFMSHFTNLYQEHSDFSLVSRGLRDLVKGTKRGHALWTIRQYIHVDNKSAELGPYTESDPSWPGGGGHDYEIIHPELGKPVRTPPKGWIMTFDEFQRLMADDRIAWKKLGTPKIKKYLLDGRENDVITSVITKESRQSVMTLKAILGVEDAIGHPKDHLVLQRLFTVFTWNDPSALIFDPYAGSGTTGHAVLAMNAEDNGNRRFILVENGDPTNRRLPRDEYTDRITAERIRRVISGDWSDGKEHPQLKGGFTFYEAKKTVSKKVIMESTRENLADIILQIVEDDSNRVDCRMDGYQYLIGKTRLGYGIALVWESGKMSGHQPLTREIRSKIMEEARLSQVTKPVYIYAVANISPLNDELYRFQQIPDSILARLNLLDDEEE